MPPQVLNKPPFVVAVLKELTDVVNEIDEHVTNKLDLYYSEMISVFIERWPLLGKQAITAFDQNKNTNEEHPNLESELSARLEDVRKSMGTLRSHCAQVPVNIGEILNAVSFVLSDVFECGVHIRERCQVARDPIRQENFDSSLYRYPRGWADAQLGLSGNGDAVESLWESLDVTNEYTGGAFGRVLDREQRPHERTEMRIGFRLTLLETFYEWVTEAIQTESTRTAQELLKHEYEAALAEMYPHAKPSIAYKLKRKHEQEGQLVIDDFESLSDVEMDNAHTFTLPIRGGSTGHHRSH